MTDTAAKPSRASRFYKSDYLRLIATPLLIGAVVLLICAVLLLGVNLQVLRNNAAWVQHTDDVLLTVSGLKVDVLNHELSLRGYALTQEPIFLHYRDMEMHALEEDTARLSRLMAADKDEQVQLARLKAMLVRHTAMFEKLFALGDGHAGDIARAITDPQTLAVMNATRQDISTLQAAELQILAARQKAEESQAVRTYAMALALVVLSFVCGAVGIALSRLGRML